MARRSRHSGLTFRQILVYFSIFIVFMTLVRSVLHAGAETDSSLQTTQDLSTTEPVDSNKLFYFAYASDLLGERLRISSPTAQKIAVVALEGYTFEYSIYSKVWKGGKYMFCLATG